jgi:hypothetical protein
MTTQVSEIEVNAMLAMRIFTNAWTRMESEEDKVSVLMDAAKELETILPFNESNEDERQATEIIHRFMGKGKSNPEITLNNLQHFVHSIYSSHLMKLSTN